MWLDELIPKLVNGLENHRGQTLVEVMVAMFIVVVGLSGTLSLLIFSLTAVAESESRVQAANFAREGIEVVRNMRDSNWLKGCPDPDDPVTCIYWNTGLQGEDNDYTAIAIFDGQDWRLDFTPNDVNEDTIQFHRLTSGLAVQGPSEDAAIPYYRLLTLNPICADDSIVESGDSCANGNDQKGIDVQSQIRWTERGKTHNLTMEEKLYNWR